MSYSPTVHLLDLDQVAARLGVHRATVEQWVKEKLIASFKMGKVRRISLQSLIEFVLAHTLNPTRPAWLTPEVESEFWARQREIVKQEVATEVQRHREREGVMA